MAIQCTRHAKTQIRWKISSVTAAVSSVKSNLQLLWELIIKTNTIHNVKQVYMLINASLYQKLLGG